MNALDIIIEEILTQAKLQADNIINEAKKEADEIMLKAESECAELKKRFEEAAEQDCIEIINRAESSDRQNRRIALLEMKNQIIDEIIFEAKSILTETADKENFKVTEQGNIILNNTIDAIFESEKQMLRDKAYEALVIK